MALDPVSAALDIGGKIIDRLWPDKAKADEAKLKLFELTQNGELAQLASETELAKGQLAVNQAEATNPNWFVSGWRPAIGWICGLALFYHFFLRPVANGFGTPMPALETSDLFQLLLGMLGLSGMRMTEKMKGVAAR